MNELFKNFSNLLLNSRFIQKEGGAEYPTPEEKADLVKGNTREELTHLKAEIEQDRAWDETSPEALAKLAVSKDVKVRLGVAYNRKTSPETLAILSDDRGVSIDGGVMSVKEAVAWNLSTSPETLAKLAVSKDVKVRRAVAYNVSTPPDVLRTLAQDKDPEVSKGAEWVLSLNIIKK